ncbi:hypothetical protein BJX76DRAFT_358525 [Aspergillus varians]
MNDGLLHLTVPGTKNACVISRFNEERILKAIRANPKVGNIWFDHRTKVSEVSLVFTIYSAADADDSRVRSHISPDWPKVLEEARQTLVLDRYQETSSKLLAADDRRIAWAKQEDRVKRIEGLSNLLDSESGDPTNLPENWKKLPLPQLESLLEKLMSSIGLC